MRRKGRGFKLGRRVLRIFKWFVWSKRRKPCCGYKRLLNNNDAPPDDQYHAYRSKTMTKIYEWGKSLKRGAKELCLLKSASSPDYNYARIDNRDPDHDPFKPKHVSVPKGHLAVYVRQKDEDRDQHPHRFLVPVFYFNHPLFGQLLREAEKEYGFHQPGGITIPCPLSEFQNVQARIAAGRNTTWKHKHLL